LSQRGCSVKRSVATVILAKRTILREGLISLLHHSNFRVVASAATPDEFTKLLSENIRLVILGVSMASREELECLEKMLPTTRNYKVVIVAEASEHADHPDILEILRSGADAYIINVHSRDGLLKPLDLAILEQKLVVLGENDLSVNLSEEHPGPTHANDYPPRSSTPPRSSGNGGARLSDRELEILSCLARGDSNKIIARSCQIAESTVKIHLKSILRKINAQNRTKAKIWAIRNGLSTASDSAGILPTHNLFHSHPDLLVAEKECDRSP
jgi:two-component system nitrate/nitrite response regulator NarL